jgi:hypothetical protein
MNAVIRKHSLKPSLRRKEICETGLDLYVLSEADVLFILRDAESDFAAERRLRQRISDR